MKLQYWMPTQFILEEDCVRNHAGDFAGFGKKALVVTGASSAKKSGALDDVLFSLQKNGQDYALFDKAEPNPSIESAYLGADFARSEEVDFVVAIGGGSPMDTAKAIALLAAQDIPRERLFSGPYGEEILPMVFVPTTAGTGSEVTPYAILTDHATQSKLSMTTKGSFPDLALLDGKYLRNMPQHTMVNTVVDALSHAMEGMLTVKANPFTDLLARESIRLIGSSFPALAENALDDEQRQKLLYASTLGGMVIAWTGTTMVHSMGYQLTYHRNIDHGRANGLLLPAFLRFTEGKLPDRVRLLLDAFGASDVSDFQRQLDRLLGEKEVFTADELANYTAAANNPRKAKNSIVPPTKEDVSWMYRESLPLEG